MKKSVFLFLVAIVSALLAFGTNSGKEPASSQKVSTDNLLAISWQNAYCQTHQKKRECRNVKPTHYSASNFTLHGLWPQPRSRQNCKGKRKVFLEKELYMELLEVMPAAKSGLQHHEWKKHGTCYGKDQEGYFKDSIYLVKEINKSPVRDLFARNVGKKITKEQLNRAFNKAFGSGSGRKVKMICKNGLITELRINLKGEITPKSDIKTLLKSAKNAKGGCKSGLVDEVGF